MNDGREGPLRGFTGRYAHMAGMKKVMVDGGSEGADAGGRMVILVHPVDAYFLLRFCFSCCTIRFRVVMVKLEQKTSLSYGKTAQIVNPQLSSALLQSRTIIYSLAGNLYISERRERREIKCLKTKGK